MNYPDSFKNHFRALFSEGYNSWLKSGDVRIGKIIKDQIYYIRKSLEPENAPFYADFDPERIALTVERLQELEDLSRSFDELIMDFLKEMQHGYRPAALSTF